MSKDLLLVCLPIANDSKRVPIERLAELVDLVLLQEDWGDWGTLPTWANDLFQAVLQVKFTESDLAVKVIQDYCQKFNYRPVGLLPLNNEAGISFLADIAPKLGLLFLSKEHVNGVRDKYQMRRLFSAHGLPSVPFAEVSTLDEACIAAEDIGYPIIIKPRLAGGSLFVRRIDNSDELRECFDEYLETGIKLASGEILGAKVGRSLILEKLIDGVTLFETILDLPVGEVSIEGFVHNGQVHVLGHHDKPLGSNGPYYEEVLWSTPSRLSASLIEELNSLAKQTVKAVNLDNAFFHIEARTTDRGPILLELGGRMGGGCIYRSLKESTGIDMVEIMYRLYTGLPIEEALLKPVHHRPVMTFGFYADEGELEAIDGLDAVKAHPLVVEVIVFEELGTYIYRAPRSYQPTLHIMVAAESHAEAEAVGLWAQTQIKFRTKARSPQRTQGDS